jgi:hypothetical protein
MTTALVTVGFVAFTTRGQCEVALLNSGSGLGDLYGGNVAIDGDLAVISDSFAANSVGAVYVYRHDGSTWVSETVLFAPTPVSGESFGASVAVSGDVIVVGAYHADAPEFQRGEAHIFRYEPDTSRWNHDICLTASDGDMGDLFGFSVSIDDDVVLIGARNDENKKGVSLSGSAYVYRYKNAAWVEEAKLIDPDGDQLDLFGASVCIDGDVALIGAHGNDHPNVGIGSAFTFRYDRSTWLPEAELTAFDSVGIQWFGRRVSLAENVALVGAPQDDGMTGAAYLFRYDGEQWLEEARLTGSTPVGPNSFFGLDVSISEDAKTIVVGAYQDFETGFAAGAAYVFRHDGDAWNEVDKLTASVGDPCHFGIGVSVRGDVAFIGAPGQSEGPGAVYIYAGLAGIDCNGNQSPDSCEIFNGDSEDLNDNGILDECEAVGDLNGDGTVGIVDFLMLLAVWGPCGDPCPPSCGGDLNGNCAVGGFDFVELLANWSTP